MRAVAVRLGGTVRQGVAAPTLIFAMAATLAIGRLWLKGLGTSFWLDETQTYYLTTGSWADFTRRLELRPFLSLPYFAFMKLLHDAGLTSELSMRLPSFIALGLTTWVVYRITLVLAPRSTAGMAALLFAAVPAVAGEATNARPYALALLAAAGALYFVIRWVAQRDLVAGLCFVTCGAIAVWLHLTYGTLLLPEISYAVLAWRRRRLAFGHLLGVGAWLLALLLPLSVRFLASLHGARELSFTTRPDLESFFESLSFSPLLVGLALGVLVAVSLGVGQRALAFRLSPEARELMPLLLGASLAPATSLFVVARLTPAQLFIERYYLPGYVAAAILAALLLQGLKRVEARAVAVFTVCLVGVLQHGDLFKLWQVSTDWRTATRAVRELGVPSNTPVLLMAGFAESNNVRNLEDPDFQPLLAGPTLLYPLPGTIINLPYALTPDTERYLESVVDRVKPHERAVLLTAAPGEVQAWLKARLGAEGLSHRPIFVPPPLAATLFVRRTAETP